MKITTLVDIERENDGVVTTHQAEVTGVFDREFLEDWRIDGLPKNLVLTQDETDRCVDALYEEYESEY